MIRVLLSCMLMQNCLVLSCCLLFLFKIPGTLHKMVSNKLMALQKGQDPSMITGNNLNGTLLFLSCTQIEGTEMMQKHLLQQ